MKKVLTILLLAFFFIYGCKEEVPYGGGEVRERTDAERATELCIAECKTRLDAGEDFSKGPCLSNSIIEDWVCDVAHKPRQAVDNEPENQCSAFRAREAYHFVELDTNCDVIKIY